MAEFLSPVGPYTLTKPYGSYLWESELSAVEKLHRWKTARVFPETHRELKSLGLCDNYRLTDAGRAALAQNRD